MSKSSRLQFDIELDEQNIPENIIWTSTDGQVEPIAAKALMVSVFANDSKETLRFDIWTKEMQIQEMDRMMFYTLRGLADTYMRATNNKELSEQFRQFAEHFGVKTEIIKPD